MTLATNRRDLLLAAAMASASAILPTAASADKAPQASAFNAKPLPFDPKAVPGLSERLLVSHHDNNYVGAV